jgi:cyclohexyl-isocyanide hydratase
MIASTLAHNERRLAFRPLAPLLATLQSLRMTNDMPPPLEVAIFVYPGVTLLDFVGPLTALSIASRVELVARALDPVASDSCGIAVVPTATLESVADVDILLVPGGMGTADVLEDESMLRAIERIGARAKYVTSVCSGSLILAAAGLLRGYRATTHWSAYETLAAFGVDVGRERVVVDRNRITGGGVTAGIDFGLTLLAHLRGERLARMSQLAMEYDPAPPFDAGTPTKAGPELTAMAERVVVDVDQRCRRVAARLREHHAAG